MLYCQNVPRNNDNDGHNYDLFVRMIIIISSIYDAIYLRVN